MKRNRKAKEMLTIFWKRAGERSSSSSYMGSTHIWMITLNMSALEKRAGKREDGREKGERESERERERVALVCVGRSERGVRALSLT